MSHKLCEMTDKRPARQNPKR